MAYAPHGVFLTGRLALSMDSAAALLEAVEELDEEGTIAGREFQAASLDLDLEDADQRRQAAARQRFQAAADTWSSYCIAHPDSCWLDEERVYTKPDWRRWWIISGSYPQGIIEAREMTKGLIVNVWYEPGVDSADDYFERLCTALLSQDLDWELQANDGRVFDSRRRSDDELDTLLSHGLALEDLMEIRRRFDGDDVPDAKNVEDEDDLEDDDEPEQALSAIVEVVAARRKYGPREQTLELAEKARNLKEKHPTWSRLQVAGKLGETPDAIRHAYRVKGWTWERADKM